MTRGVCRCVRRHSNRLPDQPCPLFQGEPIATNQVAHLGILRPTLEMLQHLRFCLLPVALEPLLFDLKTCCAKTNEEATHLGEGGGFFLGNVLGLALSFLSKLASPEQIAHHGGVTL